MRSGTRLLVLAGLATALGLAALASPWADSAPDGLERAARDQGFATDAERHPFEDSPVAGYRLDAVENSKMSTALSGIIGVLFTFGLALGVFGLLGRRRDRRDGSMRKAP